MTAPYCSPCLDVWCIEAARIERRDFMSIRPGTSLHVTCGRALEALRTAPTEPSEYGDVAA